jgi:hypothetical protein
MAYVARKCFAIASLSTSSGGCGVMRTVSRSYTFLLTRFRIVTMPE